MVCQVIFQYFHWLIETYKTKSGVKWSNVFIVQYWIWRTTRAYPWPIVIFDLRKRSVRRSHNKCHKFFVDDVSPFSAIDNTNLSAINLNSDINKINAWKNQWKTTFTPDPNKEAQEVIFSRKIKKTLLSPMNFNNNSVKQVVSKTFECLPGQ